LVSIAITLDTTPKKTKAPTANPIPVPFIAEATFTSNKNAIITVTHQPTRNVEKARTPVIPMGPAWTSR
jgi:hypothetical protein